MDAGDRRLTDYIKEQQAPRIAGDLGIREMEKQRGSRILLVTRRRALGRTARLPGEIVAVQRVAGGLDGAAHRLDGAVESQARLGSGGQQELQSKVAAGKLRGKGLIDPLRLVRRLGQREEVEQQPGAVAGVALARGGAGLAMSGLGRRCSVILCRGGLFGRRRGGLFARRGRRLVGSRGSWLFAVRRARRFGMGGWLGSGVPERGPDSRGDAAGQKQYEPGRGHRASRVLVHAE